MTKNSIKKFLSLLGTTTLVASPIIAMGGGLLSNNQFPNYTLNNKENNNIVTADYTVITCDNWTSSPSGDNTLWTCNTDNGDIILQVDISGALTVNSGKDILAADPSTTNTTYNLNLSSISGVTSLGYECFLNCTSLSQITIPNNVTSLSISCFRECKKLSKITLPDGITSLDNACFKECYELSQITLPSTITSLGYQCFYMCTSLSQITIPNSITFFGEHCFQKCEKLSQITLEEGITTLPAYCFSQCSSLSQITIPNSITFFDENCFHACTKLSQITLPNSLTSLGSSCFSLCPSLSRINILTKNDSFTLDWYSIDTEGSTEVYFDNETLYTKYSQGNIEDKWEQGYGWSKNTNITFTKYYYSFTALETTKSFKQNETATNLVIGSFKADNSGFVSNLGFNAEFVDWRSSASTSNSGITLNVVQDNSDSSGLTYNVVALWGSNQFINLNDTITFGIKVSNGDGVIVAGTGSSTTYNWTVSSVNFVDPTFSDITTVEPTKTITVGDAATDGVTIGYFNVTNWDEIDESALNFSAEITNWTATSGTTKDNITFKFEKNSDGSNATTQRYDIKAIWEGSKFTKDDSIRFDIIVKNKGSEIARTNNTPYNWTINYASKYAQNVVIEQDSNAILNADIVAGKETIVDNVVRITDVKDDTNATNWQAIYDGQYELSWNGNNNEDISNYFELIKNNPEDQYKWMDLKVKDQVVANNDYSLKVVYRFNNGPDPQNQLAGESNAVIINVHVGYEAPATGDLDINGPENLNAIYKESDESSDYTLNVRDPNVDNPDALIEWSLTVDGVANDPNVTGISLDSNGRTVTIKWNNQLKYKAESYRLLLVAKFHYEGKTGNQVITSQAETINLNVRYASPSGITMDGRDKISSKEDINESNYKIIPTSSNGNNESLDPMVFDNSSYNWSIQALDGDSRTQEAIDNKLITIDNGILRWSSDLDKKYNYKVVIIATLKSNHEITCRMNVNFVKQSNWIQMNWWWLLLLLLLIIVLIISYLVYRHYANKRKRYTSDVDLDKLLRNLMK